jgi:hypothetical protein
MSQSTPETRSAVISISKALLGVSFVTLAALGGASGVGWIAAATAAPGAALNAADSLGPLLQKLREKKEDFLEIPLPPWWSRRDDSSWQDVCTTIESRLPTILNATAEDLKKEGRFPTTSIILQVFTNQIERQMPTWDTSMNERGLVAAFVAGPFLKKVADVLKAKVDPIQTDKLAIKVEEIANEVAKLAATAQTSPGISSDSVEVTLPSQGTPGSADVLRQKWKAGAYDVYICYHKDDVTQVKEIDKRLKAAGILPWFDMRKEPGVSLQTQQQQQIKKINAAAVLIGKNAMVDWQALQVEALINEFVKRKFHVIPVFLPDAPSDPDLSIFLETFAGVDFRETDPDPFAYLMWGITGERPPIT